MSISVKEGERSGEQGSLMVVLAAIMVLVGVLVTMGLDTIRVQDPIDRNLATLKKIEFVMNQLASHVHSNRELPCPAAPNEDITTVAFGQERAGCAVLADTVGIVPFRTLNIDDRDVKDAWGRYITYAVSPVFANIPANPAAPLFIDPIGDPSIFYRCRTDDWVINAVARNANRLKTRFCCPSLAAFDSTTDLDIRDENGPLEPVPGLAGRTDPDPGGGVYGDIDTEEAVSFPGTTATAFAVVLVSHGANGAGAFSVDGTTGRWADANAGIDERENADPDNVYVDRPMIFTEGNNHFDDIVIWHTQTGLYNELNNATCARPWR